MLRENVESKHQTRQASKHKKWANIQKPQRKGKLKKKYKCVANYMLDDAVSYHHSIFLAALCFSSASFCIFISFLFRFVSFFSLTHTYSERTLPDRYRFIVQCTTHRRALVYGLYYIISLTHRDLSAQKIPPRAHNLTFTFLIVPAAINSTAIASSSSSTWAQSSILCS